ncbi:MAG: protein translocase subunit SecD [Robiginitomaculum sp.]|nr:protein translocase subunit SecD [Robiginitomaculum sp.]
MLHFSKLKQAFIWLIVLAGFFYALPNVLPESIRGGPDIEGTLPSFMPRKTVNLGLDLQGGTHLLYEVDVASVKQGKLEAAADDARQFLRSEKPIIPATGFRVSGDTVTFRLARPEQMDLALERLKPINTVDAAALLTGSAKPPFVIDSDPKSGRITLTLTPEALEKESKDAVARSIEVIRQRIDELGTREPTIQRKGDDRIIVEVPGKSDPERIKELVGQTAKMTFHLLDTSVTVAEAQAGRIPPGARLVEGSNPAEPYVLIRRRPLVDGEDLVDSKPTFNRSGQPAVSFRFNGKGARRFGKATAENVGRRFAIVLDNKVISAPVINSPILGGSGIIEGGFTTESANDLSILLRAGALPAKLTVLDQGTVGAELGADSIRAGALALIIGFLSVVVFMVIVYGMLGLISDLALIANVLLMMGALSALQATLTLPGIAGIILTIGMAVDANVLIFGRVREEYRNGKTPMNAIETGYAKARSTILDANITTLIAAVLLLQFGSGPVKGFGVTLAIGIITSVFTAFVFSRLLTSYWLFKAKPKTLPI